MDLLSIIKQRMDELGLGQKQLAAGVKVTESYISQLLTGKKPPPAPERTDIYSKMDRTLRLPKGRLAALAELKRKEELKRKVLDPPVPLFKEVRKLIIRKCDPAGAEQVQSIFERQPFGEIERLITEKLLDVVKRLAREELDNETWLRRFARSSERSYEEVRVDILEFLDTDVFHVSDENCVSFLNPLIESWSIDFVTFEITIVLNRRLGPEAPKRFRFVEQSVDGDNDMEPGLEEFLRDRELSRDVTDQEIEFLKRLRFGGARPTPLFYYREVQSLRDPLHFHEPRARTDHSRSTLKARRRTKRVGRSKA